MEKLPAPRVGGPEPAEPDVSADVPAVDVPAVDVTVIDEIDLVDEVQAVDVVDDDIVDLSDRRRLLVRVLFGVDAPPRQIDLLFDPDAG